MDDFFGVAIIYSLRQLQHDFENFEFRDLTILESLPVIVKFSTW